MLDRRSAFAIAALGLALASCGDTDATTSAPDVEERRTEADPSIQTSSLGPLTYEFDRSALTAADVEITIPPEYGTTQVATKLIPEERAQRLGEDNCLYGQSGRTSECNAEQEVGLAIAYLPRPVSEYRRAFIAVGGTDIELEPVRLDGVDGFSFTAQAEGAGTEYQFFGIEGRTILLARHFDDSVDVAATEAINEVVHSLSESVERRIQADG